MFDIHGDSATAAATIDTITTAARDENAAGARRLAAIGDLYALRAPDDDTERLNWVIDGFCGLIAELSVALSMSRRRATAQLHRAITLRERLPKVAAIYAKGLIDAAQVTLIIARTDLIIDDQVAQTVDTELATKIPDWGSLSIPKMQQRIDAIIARADPAGVRRPCPPADHRDVTVEPRPGGMAVLNATLEATVAVAIADTLDAAATGVCRGDPRTSAQRRADALAALTTGGAMACQCDDPDCHLAAAVTPAPVGLAAVIHVIAEPATLTADTPGFLPGYGQIPAEQVQALVARARIRSVAIPKPVDEPGYRPSAALAEFVRCRDLTCRFPECDRPAEHCDIDHTVPYPAGPTHPSNLKTLCRFHHLLKTFHSGWSDHQYPDGTIVWTSPTGHTYITKPEGAQWFTALGTPTGTPEVSKSPPVSPQRGYCMPTRSTTRTQRRRKAILAERATNQDHLDYEYALMQDRAEAEALADEQSSPPF